MQVWSMGGEDPLEEGMTTHSSILAWGTPWTEVPGRIQSMGSHRAGHSRSDLAQHRITSVIPEIWQMTQPVKSGAYTHTSNPWGQSLQLWTLECYCFQNTEADNTATSERWGCGPVVFAYLCFPKLPPFSMMSRYYISNQEKKMIF